MKWAHLSVLLGRSSFLIGVASMMGIALLAVRRRRAAHSVAKQTLKAAVLAEVHEPTTLHPEIDPARCAGCGACVNVCPEGDILQIINHRAVLVAPTKCVGHGECEIACPFAAITLVFGTKTRGMELPRISSNYETNVNGLYIAGELGGMGLIRNAIKQGKLAAEHALATLPPAAKADIDLLVVGAGAAGLSAALVAVGAKRSYRCIEQDSIGGTIFNFPRQKIVMTQPAVLPLVGTMKFPKNKVSKEDLLGYWREVRKKTGLKVEENCKFLGLKKNADAFIVSTTRGDISARKVILAMGVRGTPRKLGVPGEELEKVTYNLLEPEQYQRQHIAVVGGGNAAAEAVQQLAQKQYKNQVTMLVRGKTLDRANAENKSLVDGLAARGIINVLYEASVLDIQRDHLNINAGGQSKKLPNQFLFVFAGAEMPFAFLQSLGIAIEKKFGVPLRKP